MAPRTAYPIRFDHCVVHVSDWERSNRFYSEVLDAELISVNGRTAYRFGAVQLNLHGPGVSAGPLAKLPVQPGNSDLCSSGKVQLRRLSNISNVKESPWNSARY